MKYSKLAVIALFINSAEAASLKNQFITDGLREIASKAPEIGVIQHRLERLDALRPRIKEAMGDIKEVLRPLPETKEPKAPCTTCHHKVIKEYAENALKKLEGKTE